jgi:hypothetical protein
LDKPEGPGTGLVLVEGIVDGNGCGLVVKLVPLTCGGLDSGRGEVAAVRGSRMGLARRA